MGGAAAENELSPFMDFVCHSLRLLAFGLAIGALGPGSAARGGEADLRFAIHFSALALAFAVGAACLITLNLWITKRGASSLKWAIMATAFAFAASIVPAFGAIGIGFLLLVLLGHQLADWLRD